MQSRDTIFIEGLEVEAVIGVYDWERQAPQPLSIDIEVVFDIRRAAARDEVADTLDYAALADRIRGFTQASGFALIETLAERLAGLVLDEFDVDRVRLRLRKPRALAPAARAAGVELTRSR